MATSSSVLLPPGGQRVLFITAHPDDAEFLSGGTIARLTEEGRDVHYLVVTRGDKGSSDPDMTLVHGDGNRSIVYTVSALP